MGSVFYNFRFFTHYYGDAPSLCSTSGYLGPSPRTRNIVDVDSACDLGGHCDNFTCRSNTTLGNDIGIPEFLCLIFAFETIIGGLKAQIRLFRFREDLYTPNVALNVRNLRSERSTISLFGFLAPRSPIEVASC